VSSTATFTSNAELIGPSSRTLRHVRLRGVLVPNGAACPRAVESRLEPAETLAGCRNLD
jgi:hypothetical protein